MRVRHLLLATSALSVVGAVDTAQAKGFYVSIFGGANWTPNYSGFDSVTDPNGSTSQLRTATVDIESDRGFNVGGAVGVELDNWLKGLRVEGEMSYRRNKLHGDFTNAVYTFVNGNLTDFDAAEGGVIHGHSSTFAVLANVWYDFDCGWKIKPYIGGGAGWARTTLEFAAPVTEPGFSFIHYDFADERSGFAYQLGVGFNYEVMPDVSVGLGYRYFRGPDVRNFVFDPDYFSPQVAVVELDNENHSVNLSLTVGIN